MPTPLESITIRVPPPVLRRLESQAKKRGETVAVFLRDTLTRVASTDQPTGRLSDSDLLARGLEAVAKELADLRANERASTALLLARLDALVNALSRSVEALLRVDATDVKSRFTTEQIRAFVARVFGRSE